MNYNDLFTKEVRFSVGLLSKKAKRFFAVVLFIGPILSFLDLIAISILALTISSISSLDETPRYSKILLELNKVVFRVDLDESPRLLFIYLLFFATILMLIKTFLITIYQFILAKFLAGEHAAVSKRLTHSYFSQNIDTVNRFSSQETSFILNHGIYYSINSTLGSVVNWLSEISLLIGILCVLFYFYPVPTIILLIYLFFTFVATHRFLSIRAEKKGQQATLGYIKSVSRIQEPFRLHRELFISSQHKDFQRVFDEQVTLTADGYAQQNFLSQLPKVVFEASLLVGLLLMSINALLDSESSTRVALISTLIVAGVRIAPSLIKLQGALITMRVVRPSVAKVQEFKEYLTDSSSSRSQLLSEVFNPSISLTKVSYAFPENLENLFEDVSLEIQPFEVVAIFGPTGAGKSTLVDLMMGFREPSLGSSRISDFPAKQSLTLWPRKIAFLNQKVSLIEGSVAQNIALGCFEHEIDIERVTSLIKAVNLEDLFLGEIDVSQSLGEDGLGISGGQRQRLAIARALYWEPEMLVLDEATSAQDSASQLSIIELIKELRGKCTVILIAHSKDLLQMADRFFYIEKGKIQELKEFE